MTNSAGPLKGIKVIEIARFVTGPFCGQLLGDLGADVIKIEDTNGGDPFRGWSVESDGYGAPFVAFNRNKRSLTLDLRAPESRDILFSLIDGADVLIENFRPGGAAKLGIDYDMLKSRNPKLVYCAITGVGTTGRYAGRACYDAVGQGLSGLLSLLVDREDPQPVGPTFSDTLTGLFAAYGVLAALNARATTHLGQRIDTSLLQATMGFMHEAYAVFFKTGHVPNAYSRPQASQVYAFVCRDGLPLVVHLSSPDKFWQGFVTALDRTDLAADARYKTHGARRQHWKTIHAELKPLLAAQDRAYWLERFAAADVPAAPIHQVNEALDDPQVREAGMQIFADHPKHGRIDMVGYPVTLSDTPSPQVIAPPVLGEHTDTILAELGYDAESVRRFHERGIV
ncbi:CaiB/BaiF CoA transferase family protein [Paraburkholderia caffeinilytica]|uniref:CaiB/BaiF CoA transferase family protein n=1 Tax=Paraburkholderia caffeinilytica TaxID=1761016 RepID=UPI003DA0189C